LGPLSVVEIYEDAFYHPGEDGEGEGGSGDCYHEDLVPVLESAIGLDDTVAIDLESGGITTLEGRIAGRWRLKERSHVLDTGQLALPRSASVMVIRDND
jgi:hypothetical protein